VRRSVPIILSALVAMAPLLIQGSFAQTTAWRFPFLSEADNAAANEILNGRRCPCGCGRFLPGSRQEPACFGCSVGKTELSRVSEGLRAGRPSGNLILELEESVWIDVFGDYTDPDTPAVWEIAKTAAAEAGQHRVFLRPPALTVDAVRAIRIVECARDQGVFFAVQEAFIAHAGPWDTGTLLDVAMAQGADRAAIKRCLKEKAVRAQVAKDHEHAHLSGIRGYPATAVNRRAVEPTREALRAAIFDIIEDESI
jgi:hypothetical protein